MSEWQRPKGCSTNECIEVRIEPRHVEIRGPHWLTQGDDWRRAVGMVLATRPEWAVFVAAVKNGEFDVPEL